MEDRVTEIARVLTAATNGVVESSSVEGFVKSLLYGKRELLAVLQLGLITPEEAAHAVVDRYYTGRFSSGQIYDEVLRARLEAAHPRLTGIFKEVLAREPEPG
ncbi:MAG: hypothetical protein AAF645_18430 [Myxococcota bacterium]